MQFSDLDLSKSYTYADYLLWEMKERVEIIKGKIFKMSPAPSMVHQRISSRMHNMLYNYFQSESCDVFSAPFDVRLVRKGKNDEEITTVVQPDICVVCDKNKLDQRGCVGAPDLVVEILSPSNSKKEMKEKFEVYEESGVKEYWLVNFVDKNVICYALKDRQYYGLKPFIEDEILTSTIFEGMEIDLSKVFKEG